MNENKNSMTKNKEKNIDIHRIISIFYGPNFVENNCPYLYVSSLFPKFREGTYILNANSALDEQAHNKNTIKSQMTEQHVPKSFNDCELFHYDNSTTIPYKILNINNKKDNAGKRKLIIFVLNDYFDSLATHRKDIFDLIDHNIMEQFRDIDLVKIILFNFPGQEFTTWASKDTFNNLFYSKILDRFIFYLYNERKEFIINDKVLFVGYGNGGYIGLTYLSLYEEIYDIFKGIILVDPILAGRNEFNVYMDRLHNYILDKRNSKMNILQFIDTLKQQFIHCNYKYASKNVDDNCMSVDGYLKIIEGSRSNIKVIRNKIISEYSKHYKILKTEVIVIHDENIVVESIFNLENDTKFYIKKEHIKKYTYNEKDKINQQILLLVNKTK